MDDCTEDAFCNGRNATCPNPDPKPDNVTECNQGTQVCSTDRSRVSVHGVKSQGFEFYEVKKKSCYYFSKGKWKYFYTFNHFYSEKSSKRAK